METSQYRDATRAGEYSTEKEKARPLGAGTEPHVHGKHEAEYSAPTDRKHATSTERRPYTRRIPEAYELPPELVALPRWIVYRFVHRPGKAKPDKIPVSAVTGSGKGWTHPSAWATFEQAQAYAEANGCDGLGLVLSDGCGIAGIDLDHCRDMTTGGLSPTAQSIIDAADTYTEVSPGLNGVRALAFGSFGGHTGNKSAEGIEFYGDGDVRFLTITGDHIESSPFAMEHRDLTELGARYFPAQRRTQSAVEPPPSFRHIDLATLALSPHTRAVITAGDASRYGGDRSKAIFGAAKDLMRAGYSDADIICILCDPEYGISEAALSRRDGDIASSMEWIAQYTISGARAEVEAEPSAEHGAKVAEAIMRGSGGERGEKNQGDVWPEIVPLPALRPPVQDFSTDDLLPESLRPWLSDIADRMQCPPEFPAVGALIALSSLVGRQIAIRPKRHDDWTVVPNLWGAIIARPGALKSPALEEAMKPLHRLKYAAMDAHKRDMTDHASDAMIHAARLEAAQSALKAAAKGKKANMTLDDCADEITKLTESAPQAPVMRRYMTNDSSHEKLGELLSENPMGILVFRDELVSWLRGLDREGREEGRGFFLQGWNGTGGYTFDRIIRGTVHIEATTISILGGIQPGPLADYVGQATSNGAGNDGLLQRFQLLVWPDDPNTWRNVDRWPDTVAKANAYEVFERLDNIDASALGADISDDIPFLRFASEAQDLFNEWRAELERVKLRSGESEALEAHLSKYRSLAPSLALLFHLVDGIAGPVSVQATAMALDWCEYAESHARRVYGVSSVKGLGAAHALAEKIRMGKVPATFKPSDLYLKGWSKLDREGIEQAIEVLEDCGWLASTTTQPGRKGGRPSTTVTLNPGLGVAHA